MVRVLAPSNTSIDLSVSNFKVAVNGRSILGALMTLIESESYLFNKEVICLNELLSIPLEECS